MRREQLARRPMFWVRIMYHQNCSHSQPRFELIERGIIKTNLLGPLLWCCKGDRGSVGRFQMHRYLTPEINGEGRNYLVAQLPPSKASISHKPPIFSAQHALALSLDLAAREAQFNRPFDALAGSFGPHCSVCSTNGTFKGISGNDVRML
jgi:hypothetical protein